MTRKLLLTSVSFAALIAGPAVAADLGAQVHGRPVVVAAPVYSWTGFYIGIGGGTGWGNKEYSWNQDATVAADIVGRPGSVERQFTVPSPDHHSYCSPV